MEPDDHLEPPGGDFTIHKVEEENRLYQFKDPYQSSAVP